MTITIVIKKNTPDKKDKEILGKLKILKKKLSL